MPSDERPVRDLADAYVEGLAELDPIMATMVGIRPGDDRMPDFSPSGQESRDGLARATLRRLDEATGGGTGGDTDPADGDERRCGRLLRERLGAALATSAAGEPLRDVSNLMGPVQQTRTVFTLMPTETPDDWAVVARRMARVPEALAGYRASLTEGLSRGLLAAPLQASTLVEQLAQWNAAAEGRGWFAGFTDAAEVPPALRTELEQAAASATSATTDLRCWLADEYLPRAEGTPDGVGEERYRVAARQWTGADLDLAEAYQWGWAEYRRLVSEIEAEAARVLPGASAAEAMAHLDEHSEVVHGVEEIRLRLQRMMDEAIAELDGTHFDLTEPMRTVEARIAPAGSAAAPYYSRPSKGFARPGRTWLPTLGRTSFPLWGLISTWYHEGVPGHHLQFAQWTGMADRLSTYQATVGSVSACSEGWALYAERLMDELGYLEPQGARIGYLEAQLMRAVRVVIDIGMHLGLPVPAGSPVGDGQRWTPELGRAFMAAHSGRGQAFVDSEIVRYLGRPAQAISYKLGERAWLAGREAAKANHGAAFDLKSWHMSALALGALGLDDLAGELAAL
ncbi:DUF885 domain-containing protein [Amycolatopsis antarctica]|uniref:DUF885 domain-containing protein n=1 Tax=Amycolatopsis antarctica TaxID=1854586 RepID=A0A263D2V1_9PSEU|nr:DUF885 domain-containing protein [Amycolatopsis antarctica]OZM72804.1 DUF885 domain-containing protein [Amycolatopsis antarctica]